MTDYENYPKDHKASALQDPPKEGTGVSEEQPETGNNSDPFAPLVKAWDNMSPDRQHRLTYRLFPTVGALSLSLAGVLIPLTTRTYTEEQEVEVPPATVAVVDGKVQYKDHLADAICGAVDEMGGSDAEVAKCRGYLPEHWASENGGKVRVKKEFTPLSFNEGIIKFGTTTYSFDCDDPDVETIG